ncbi:helix-turn-helix domain-containing protein [Halosimplex aquaticum]
MSAEVVETGEYDPGVRQLFDRLTARQREVLETAVRAGYYDDPRRATHADLAAELDVSPATVGEHLRKIESRVFSGFVAGE